MTNKVTAIVLAGGKGVRMRSQKPKVLHDAAGRSLIEHVISNLFTSGINRIRVVVGHGGEQVKQHLWGRSGIEFFTQAQQLGTADAVKAAQVGSLSGPVLICNGDHPLIRAADFIQAINTYIESECEFLITTCHLKKPTGYGRIVRNGFGRITSIIEEKDATLEQKKINEVNPCLYVIDSRVLRELLPQIGNNNAKKEFYFTDIVNLAVEKNVKIHTQLAPPRVNRGVNNQRELSEAGRALYYRKCIELMEEGVTIVDPHHTYIEEDVKVMNDTVIGPGSFIAAGTVIGSGCQIEGNCIIRSSEIGDKVEVRWGSIVDSTKIGASALIGPYARLRPESIVGEEAHVGNFVELKKTTLGARSKANHLTYLGDAEIGEDTNIGCGTITCNYAVDRKKYKTKIGKNVFVGSDTQFVAPITIGDGAVIASGSTITKDVPPNALAVARMRQMVKPGYTKKGSS